MDAAAGKNVGLTQAAAAQVGRERRAKEEARLLADYREQLASIRSWYGSDTPCPYGDPAEMEAALVRKIRDQYGAGFLRKVMEGRSPGAERVSVPAGIVTDSAPRRLQDRAGGDGEAGGLP